MKHMIERHALGVTAACQQAIEDALREANPPHPPLPLAIALQFWAGDQEQALRLARFLADIEPEPRDDVLFIFARANELEMSPALEAAELYCGRKFPVIHVVSGRQGKGHLGGSYAIWAGTAEKCWQNFSTSRSWPWQHVFFIEHDGVPLARDWIDRIARAHAANLLLNKRVTGARMEACPCCPCHVNGSLVMDLRCWAERPTLWTCPPGKAWDCFHAETLLSEWGPNVPIVNLYGAQDISPSVFQVLSNGRAWLANVKDESAWNCAQRLARR